MYESFYCLTSKPFSIAPDPSFLYWAPAHRMAYTMLEYGVINHASFTVVTGEVGAGKTTLVRHLLQKLPTEIEVGFLPGVQGRGDDLLEWALMAFGQDAEGRSDAAQYRHLHGFLSNRWSQGRRAVLIIDEAQMLSAEALERLRLLSNINSHDQELLQIILSGQPELKALLAHPDMTPFVQRVSSDFHLGLLSAGDVPRYIAHRLSVAGVDQPLFSNEAAELIYSATFGTPRLINAICEMSLIYGFAVDAAFITADIVRRVLEDKREHGVFAAVAAE
ncbi:MAG: AAA family ATPase [Hyphomicrobiales bacterium]|nr:AAA family ATPase [Hyphomicrobiales bacterium]